MTFLDVRPIPCLVPGNQYLSPSGTEVVTVVDASTDPRWQQNQDAPVRVRTEGGSVELWPRRRLCGWRLYDVDGYAAARQAAFDGGFTWVEPTEAT